MTGPAAIIDRELLNRRRARAARAAVPGADFLHARAEEELVDRLAVVNRVFDVAVDASAAGSADRQLATSGKVRRTLAIRPASAARQPDTIVADDEALPLGHASADLFVSLLAMHAMNDLPGALAQIRRALRPDGLFIGCMAGAGTLAELRESLAVAESEVSGGISPRVFPFADVRDVGALLQRAGFALPVADLDVVTVRYGSMFDLMRDLRAMGATNVLTDRIRTPSRRDMFMRAARHYAERFADADGRIRATFAFIWMSGWSPHESQQKPLRPGAGKVSLAAALQVPGSKPPKS